ncbi:MAG: carbohydrate ABC transporter permease [Chloroflexota bacterium]
MTTTTRAAPRATLTQRTSSRKIIRTVIVYTLLILLSTLFIFPFFYTVMSSLKAPWEVYTYPPTIVPSRLLWGNYPKAMSMAPFGTWFVNTLIIVVLATAGTVLSASFAAFGFARFKFRFRDALFIFTLSTMMLPAQVTLIPRYILFYQLGQKSGVPFLNTLMPLWLPAWFGGGAFAIFLVRQFIQTIPLEMDEAAVIDGASWLRIYSQIIMPLCKPAVATLAIISVVGQWSSFIEPLIYINDPAKFPISVGLQYFQNVFEGMELGEPKLQYLMAASVVSGAVPIAVFFAFQRYFVQGVVMSGIKG